MSRHNRHALTARVIAAGIDNPHEERGGWIMLSWETVVVAPVSGIPHRVSQVRRIRTTLERAEQCRDNLANRQPYC